MIFMTKSKELQELFGPEYDGRLELYISGSQGVSYGWLKVQEGEQFDTLDELVKVFQDWTAEHCQDYRDDYIQDVSDYYGRDEMDEALDSEEIDEDEYDAILDEALAETIVDCGDRYIKVLASGREFIFDGYEVLEEGEE